MTLNLVQNDKFYCVQDASRKSIRQWDTYKGGSKQQTWSNSQQT